MFFKILTTTHMGVATSSAWRTSISICFGRKGWFDNNPQPQNLKKHNTGNKVTLVAVALLRKGELTQDPGRAWSKILFFYSMGLFKRLKILMGT